LWQSCQMILLSHSASIKSFFSDPISWSFATDHILWIKRVAANICVLSESCTHIYESQTLFSGLMIFMSPSTLAAANQFPTTNRLSCLPCHESSLISSLMICIFVTLQLIKK
jgi:hypothetical protein